MLKQLLAATSLAALLAGSGAATAQDSGAATAPAVVPPGATPAPSGAASPTADPATTPPLVVDPAAPAAAPVQTPGVPPSPATTAAPGSSVTAPADVIPAPQQPGGAAPPSPPAAATAATPDPATAPAPVPTPVAAPPATPAATTPGAPVSADDMMGRQVQGSDGEPLGRVSDVVIDASTGTIQRLVIASGGFLGIGAKTVALDFGQVELRPEGGIVAKGLTQADVERMPVYDVAAETRPLAPPPAGPAVPPAGGLTGPAVPPSPGEPVPPATADRPAQ